MLRQSSALLRSSRSLCAVLVVAAAACGGGDSVPVVEGLIDRETFIEVYVDLRAETLLGTELTLPDADRDRILESHGVDAESLLAFVDTYGRELEFMNQVWAEVELRLEAYPPAAPGTDGPGR